MHPAFRSPSAVHLSTLFRDISKVVAIKPAAVDCCTQESSRLQVGHISVATLRTIWEAVTKHIERLMLSGKVACPVQWTA